MPGRKDDFLFVLHAAAAAHHSRGGDHGGDVPRDAHHRAPHLHLCAGAETGPGAQHDRRQVKQDKEPIISATGDRLQLYLEVLYPMLNEDDQRKAKSGKNLKTTDDLYESQDDRRQAKINWIL